MKVEVTMPQLVAIAEMADSCEAMLGGSDQELLSNGGDWDTDMRKKIKLIDRFLKKNRFKR